MRKWWMQRKLLRELHKLELDIDDLNWVILVKLHQLDVP